jgi:hypothetical protein
VLLTNVVGRLILSNWTEEPGTNPVPLIVRVRAGLASGALMGDIETSVGTGLLEAIGGGLCQRIELPPAVHVCPS